MPPADDRDVTDAICDAVVELQAAGDGDVLVFCSGEREIRDATEALEARNLRFTEVLPLYARLSVAEQHRVFAPHTGRRVVIATNVAETSLDRPGDPVRGRQRHGPHLALLEADEGAAAADRADLARRRPTSAPVAAAASPPASPSACTRRPTTRLARDYTEPEILRTNLASVILQMAEAELGDIVDFPFVEPPDAGQITDGLRTLTELGALADRSTKPRLTPVGHQLARLPVDPRLGRMLVEAAKRGCLREMQVIVSALAIPDVRERPQEKREQADTFHRRFWAAAPGDDGEQAPPDGSDFLALVRLWNYLRERRHEISGNAFRPYVPRRVPELPARPRVAGPAHADPPDLRRAGTRPQRRACPGRPRAHLDPVRPAQPRGAARHALRTYGPAASQAGPARPARVPRRARREPGRSPPDRRVAKTPPPLAVAYELVETTRLWARTVAGVEAEWIEAVAEHVLSRTYAEPHWSESQGSVVALETVSLYGVPIIAGRTVQYSRIDPVETRRIFIQSALVEGHWRTRHHFVTRNATVREQAAELEERTRRRDLVVDDATIFAFYDERIPADVVSQRHFDTWWRTKRQDDDAFLDLNLSDLVVDDEADISATGFPDWWKVGSHELEITYVFDPGSQHDGVTIEIPVAVLNQLPPAAFTWSVPGYREDLATELIRSLPKSVRTSFVPAPNHAAAALGLVRTAARRRLVAAGGHSSRHDLLPRRSGRRPPSLDRHRPDRPVGRPRATGAPAARARGRRRRQGAGTGRGRSRPCSVSSPGRSAAP